MREKTKSRPSPRPTGKPAQREVRRPSLRLPSAMRLPGGVSGVSGRTQGFVRDLRSEYKKVVWPTREEWMRLTLIVIAVSVAMGFLLGGVDYLFKLFFELLISAF